MYVVAGITGQIGAVIARTLSEKGLPVRALLRDPSRLPAIAGVEGFAADLTDQAALQRAFHGAKAAWMLAPPAPQHPDLIGQAIGIATAIRGAARAAGLPRLVFLSSEAAHLTRGTGAIRQLHVAEAMLEDAAAEVTFLRPAYFQENWRAVFGLAQAQGILPSFLVDPRASRGMVATRDIGEVAASLLIEQPVPPRLVELTSARTYSAQNAADAAAAVLGRQVALATVPRAAWQSTLEGAGIGPAYAALLVEMYEGINSGWVRHEGVGLQAEGRTTLEETFRGWL